MTAAPHSIDPTTYLDDLLAQVSPDLMRQMLQGFTTRSSPPRLTPSAALNTASLLPSGSTTAMGIATAP